MPDVRLVQGFRAMGLLMKMRTQTRRLTCLVLCLIATLGSGAAAQTSGPKFTRQSDVIYGRKFGMALTMEVFAAPTRNGIGVVWVVSSSGRSSREQTLQDSFERRITPLLEHGYTVFAVIHGSAPIFNVQDQVSDVRRAVRFVRHRAAEFGIDGQRLGISGSSAGGLLALVVAMQERDGDPTAEDVVERESSRVQAVGCFFPPTDLLNFGGPAEKIVDLMQKRDGSVDPTFQFYDLDAKTGARRPLTAREEVIRMLQEYSPVTHVTAGDPPTILIHGDQDKAVPVQQSRRLIERLNAANVPARLVVREGAGHAYPGWEADAALFADWFDAHLRRVR
jgi:acetyl esterase/lipase